MRKSFSEFVQVTGQWWWVVVAGFVSSVLGLWQQLVDAGVIGPVRESPVIIPAWLWYIVGIVAVFVGCFAAFHRMRVERDAARGELGAIRARVPTPHLEGEILQLVAGQYPESHSVGIALQVQIRNVGDMPTILQRWGMTFVLLDGRTIQPRLIHKENIELNWASGGVARYTRANLIYEKTATVPIGVGGAQAGVLIGETIDAKVPELMQPGVIVRVTCDDVKGQAYTFELTFKGSASSRQDRYYPGV